MVSVSIKGSVAATAGMGMGAASAVCCWRGIPRQGNAPKSMKAEIEGKKKPNRSGHFWASDFAGTNLENFEYTKLPVLTRMLIAL